MIFKRDLQCYLVVIFIKLLGAQEVPNTSSNQGSPPSSVQPRFSDPPALGFPNFAPGRFGNPSSNYPTNSFFPFGNQNNNMQRRPQQGSRLNYPNQGNYQNRPQGYPSQQAYPNLQGYPYQGDSMNPSPNYHEPQYPSQNIPNRPGQGGYPYQGGNSHRYPNYQRPSYPNRPDDGSITYPDDMDIPYQNGGMPPNLGSPGQPYQYPAQGNQYPSQGNFQGNGNPNEINTNYRPDDLGNFPDTNIHFPDQPYQYQPNQYYPETNYPNQNYRPVQGKPENYPNNYYPSNNNYNPNTNIQFPTDYPGNMNGDPSVIQFPNQGISNPGGTGNGVPGPSVNRGFNNVFQNPPPTSQLPDNQENIPNDNDTTAILGKPVIVAPATTSPGQAVLENSTEMAATQKKCVQDCPTTSEYDPLCGTDNVTYINSGKFTCAQNCGVAVHLLKKGRCPDVNAPNTSEK